MSQSDYHYYSLQQNGTYQRAFESIPESDFDVAGKTSEAADMYDRIMKGVFVDAGEVIEPGLMENVAPTALSMTGYTLDNIPIVLVNIMTALTQWVDSMNSVDPEYGD